MKKEKKNNKIIKKILPIMLFFIGLNVFCYPFYSAWLTANNQTVVINEYISMIDSFSEEEIKDQQDIIDKYNEEILKDNNIISNENQIQTSNDSQSNEQTETVSYIDFINAGTVLGILEIDKIDVKLPIYQGCSDNVLRFGVGHLEKSSMPTEDKTAHVALTGHRGLPTSKLFTDLDKVEVGDDFMITFLGKKFTYKVDQIKIVNPEEINEINIIENHNYTTLITCTPVTLNTHRLLVRGELYKVEYEKEIIKAEKVETKPENLEVKTDVIEKVNTKPEVKEENNLIEEITKNESEHSASKFDYKLNGTFKKYHVLDKEIEYYEFGIIVFYIIDFFVLLMIIAVIVKRNKDD